MRSFPRLLALRSVIAIATLAPLHAAFAQTDPGERGSFSVRSERIDIRVRDGKEKTFVDVRLPAGPSFARPVVLICHGWAAPVSNYERIADHLASRGFAAVLFQQPDRWSGDTPTWAKQIRDALTELERLDASARSPIFGELDLTRIGLIGHSYGGAAVTLVAARDPRVKACVAMAPVNQWNRSRVIDAAGKIASPFLVIAGDSDWLATNKTYTRPIYKAAASASAREYVEIRGGGHNLYTGSDDKAKLALRYATAWLERFLRGAADPSGYTDGSQAKRDREAKKLSDYGSERRASVGMAAAITRAP